MKVVVERTIEIQEDGEEGEVLINASFHQIDRESWLLLIKSNQRYLHYCATISNEDHKTFLFGYEYDWAVSLYPETKEEARILERGVMMGREPNLNFILFSNKTKKFVDGLEG